MRGIAGLTLGRYELRRRVAQGGMAEVYLACDRRLRRQVAVKVLYGRNEAFVRRFEREASAVGALSNDHILPLYDFGEQSPWYYLVMPYIEGGTLREYLSRRKRLTLQEAGSFVDQIASALQYAHDHGVVHRDVKPSYILLRPDGYAYLADFGLARAMIGVDSLTSAGTIVGTPEYMAPEQSNGINDYRSDIYSLGVILYQMLTERVPFTADSPVAIFLKHIQAKPTPPRELNSEIPQSVEDAILKVLAKDPNERYQEVQAFSAAYWKALQQEQTCTKVDDAALSHAVEVESETGDETLSKNPLSAETAILAEAEQVLMRSPTTPLLFPLVQNSEPTVKEPESTILFPRKRSGSGIRRIHPRQIALTCLTLLILAMPLGLIWQAQQTHHPNTLHSSPALTSQQQLEASLTATAAAQATMAAQARTLAPAGFTSGLDTGHLLYTDDMKSTGGGWLADGSQCYFSPEGYHVQTFLAHVAAWCYSNEQQFSDFKIIAQAQLLRGDVYGFAFRLNPWSPAFYVLEISSQGEYRFVRALGRDPRRWLTLIDWTYSTAILSGYGSTNTFFAVIKGSHFSFYINKQLIVTTFTDTLYTSGFIGFLVGGDSIGGTEAVFSNVAVYQA